MTDDVIPGKPTTMTNGWYCPQCKKLTEHIFIYKRTKYFNRNDNRVTIRNIQCIKCKETTPLKARTPYGEKSNSRSASKTLNSGRYYGNGRSVEKDLRVTKEKIWGRPKNE